MTANVMKFCAAISYSLGIVVLVCIAGCNSKWQEPVDKNASQYESIKKMRDGAVRIDIPIIPSGMPYQNWHLKVYENGIITWNGRHVDFETLHQYLNDLSKMPESEGVLVVHINKNAPHKITYALENLLIQSTLCKDHRCFQDTLDYERPIINRPPQISK